MPRAEHLGRDGDPARARELLAEVDAAYQGDAFADEPYEDWADGLREQTRSVWLRALRELARLHRRDGAADRAATTLVRLLDADAYDEWAHHTLVATLIDAGRHGEARRAFERWSGAMRAIDAPPPGPCCVGQTGRSAAVEVRVARGGVHVRVEDHAGVGLVVLRAGVHIGTTVEGVAVGENAPDADAGLPDQQVLHRWRRRDSRCRRARPADRRRPRRR